MDTPSCCVHLMTSLSLLPHHSHSKVVKVDGGLCTAPTLIQCNPTLQELTELYADDALVSPSADGTAHIVLTNHSGFTQTLDSGTVIEHANSVVIEAFTLTNQPDREQDSNQTSTNHEQWDTNPVLPLPDEHVSVLQVEDTSVTSHPPYWLNSRLDKLDQVLADSQLHPEQNNELRDLLHAHNEAFCVEDTEHRETDVVKFHIDTGASTPIHQRVHRMPFALRKEVVKQLQKMQQMGIIQPSSSP